MADVYGNAGLEVLKGSGVSLVKPFPLNPEVKPLLLFSPDPRKLPSVFQVGIHPEFRPVSTSITPGAATLGIRQKSKKKKNNLNRH